jgi:alpha-tubulin suppressor-like RCC1 family protein
MKLFGWGKNLSGQLGNRDLELVQNEPINITSLFVEQKEEMEDVIFDEDEII